MTIRAAGTGSGSGARRPTLLTVPLTRRTCGIALASVALSVAGCRRVDPQISGSIRLATGSQTAVYYQYGKVYADLIQQALPRTRPVAMVTAASAENVRMVEHGDAEIGFSQADIVTTAAAGSIAALARLYDDCLHLVVRADSQVTSLAALRGRRISIGEVGSGTEVTAKRVLTVADLDQDRDIAVAHLGIDASAKALRERKIDAFFFSGGLPVTAIARLATDLTIRLIDLKEYVGPLRGVFGDHYTERVVPSSIYDTPPMITIDIPNYLIVPTRMPEATAYALAWVLFGGRERLAATHPVGISLTERNAISTPPLRLHPGAMRYYRSAKI